MRSSHSFTSIKTVNVESSGWGLLREEDILFSLRWFLLFYQSFPNFSLEIHEENVKTLEQYLKEDKIDLALCTILSESAFEKRRDSLQVQVLSQEAIVLCVPKSSSWSLVAQTRDGFPHPWIDLKLFSQEHFLLLKDNTRLGSLSRQILAQYNMEVTSTTFSIIDTILELIGQGYGVAFASDFRLMNNAYSGNLDIFSVGDCPIAWEFAALCGSGKMRQPQINYIINYVKNSSGAGTGTNRNPEPLSIIEVIYLPAFFKNCPCIREHP